MIAGKRCGGGGNFFPLILKASKLSFIIQDSHGQYLYALCEEDGVWYRASDVYNNSDNSFTVLLIDYGTYITVHEPNLVSHVEEIPPNVDMDEWVIQDVLDYENEDDLYDYDGVPYAVYF